ncbi:MAG: U32 family peptidase [Victivallales bacterium]|nr:U32 family peptidase [Victivallales bacterium]
MTTSPTPEILAPAGSLDILKAGLAAGADAFYLGLKNLNARNGAKNFLPDELREAVQLAHAKNARIYLTLNTALSQRELGLAARSLVLAQDCGVDGVLISDPALLAMKEYFPKLEFHFSTQAGVSSSAGVEAAKKLGLTRVVLARELSFDEIRAAAAIDGIETEVFVQGALCFCCSGRCLLSSWGGGRSGNRGACTSPCRVPWTNADGVEARPMSMRDLSLTDWVEALADAGVDSLKIEGRLKSASWVSKAVALYRQVLDHTAPPEEIRQNALTLGDYTGRDLTDGYLRGDRNGLTAVSGRVASTCSCQIAEPQQEETLAITVSEDDKHGTLWQFSQGTKSSTYRTPPQRIANPRRAVSVAEALEAMKTTVKSPVSCTLPQELATKLLPRSAVNNAVEAFSAFLRSLSKEDDGMPRGLELPAELKPLLAATPSPCPSNSRPLGSAPTRIRLPWDNAIPLPNHLTCILECSPQSMEEAERIADAITRAPRAIASIPQVIYEYQITPIKRLVEKLVQAGRTIEVNSWDTWQIASECHATMEAGPGLAVLNALAARKLFQLGCCLVSVSQEIDRNQLQDLCAAADVPLSITVFGRPALMTTRAKLPTLFADTSFADTRGITLQPEHIGELTILRPARPFDWRNLRNPAVKAAELVLDLNGYDSLPPPEKQPFLFNYDRRLR